MLTQFAGVRPPRVAVVIGCHDQAAYVEAAIRSVAAQSYQDFECVVIDDSSSDGSSGQIQETLASLGDARFRAILRSENGGQMVTMLEGLDATSGPLIAFLDADDLWHPAFLERHVLAHLSEQGVAAVSCSNLAVIDAEGVQLSGGRPNFIGGDPRRSPGKHKFREEKLDTETRLFVERDIVDRWLWSATSAMMFRRVVIDILRPARPERLRICTDHYLARASHMLGGTVRIERSLGCHRLHSGNGLARNRVLGDRTALGRPPEEIIAASREAFVERLCSMAEELCAMLPPAYLRKLLVANAGPEGASALAKSSAGARFIMSTKSQPGSGEAPPPVRPQAKPRVRRHRLADWMMPGRNRAKTSD